MKNCEEAKLGITAQERILYVTDFAEDDREAIDGFSRLASARDASLEVVHAVDIEHCPSSHDAHMGAQFRLDMLIRQVEGFGTECGIRDVVWQGGRCDLPPCQ